MDYSENVREEKGAGKVASFPQSTTVSSDIAIVDSRSCLRDAMAASIRNSVERRILSVESTAHLARSPFCTAPSPRQLILFCDGALDLSATKRELASLCDCRPNAKLVLLTDHLDDVSLSTMKEFGVDGVIPSFYDTRQVLACLQIVESGIEYFPATLIETAAHGVEKPVAENSQDICELLTPRQRQVMEFIAVGRSNKYIAAELSVSESTIKVHVHEVMKRLGATSRTHACYILSNQGGAPEQKKT